MFDAIRHQSADQYLATLVIGTNQIARLNAA
ncbi:Uncharacterised protein [Vibrio cholerae]|nr:Uncharacterised protein [Vibrio cholerae]